VAIDEIKNNEVEILSGQKNLIYFIDHDRNLLKKIGPELAQNFSDCDIIAMDNFKDAQDEMLKNKASVIILSIESPQEDAFEFVRLLKGHEIYKDIPLIALGTRQNLEAKSDEILKFNMEMVPKAIRVPYLMSVVSTCLRSASAINAQVIHLESRQVLFREGTPSESIFILKSGKLHVFKEQNKQEVPLGDLDGVQMLGEMSFIEGSHRGASVKAITPAEVLELKLKNMEIFLKGQPFWLGMMLKTLVGRIKDCNTKIVQLEQENTLLKNSKQNI